MSRRREPSSEEQSKFGIDQTHSNSTLGPGILWKLFLCSTKLREYYKSHPSLSESSSIAVQSHFLSPNDHHVHIVQTFKLIIHRWKSGTFRLIISPVRRIPPPPHMMIIRITAAWPHSALHRINSRCEGRHACK